MLRYLLPVIISTSTFSAHAYNFEKYQSDNYFQIQYNGFSMFYDCENKAPVIVEAIVGPDKGNLERKDNFRADPKVPEHCQQSSSKTYPKFKGQSFHRGHIIDANIMDNNRAAMQDTFYRTNIHQQYAKFNTSGWKATEELAECAREQHSAIKILAGLVFNDPSNDYFLKTHKAKTADIWWKVIVTPDGYYAFVFPNSNSVTASKISQYMVDISEIEKLIELPLALPEGVKAYDRKDIPNTKKCHLS